MVCSSDPRNEIGQENNMDSRVDQVIDNWGKRVGSVQQPNNQSNQDKYWADRANQKRITKKLDLQSRPKI